MERKAIFHFYLAHTPYINNWDLVDASAEEIIGGWLYAQDLTLLHQLAKSKALWERRIAIMATFHFLKRGIWEPTYQLSETLLTDSAPLIHKASGWMLREMGKLDARYLRHFLEQHAYEMPRTMLRYAIERLPHEERKYWLAHGKKTNSSPFNLPLTQKAGQCPAFFNYKTAATQSSEKTSLSAPAGRSTNSTIAIGALSPGRKPHLRIRR